MRGFLVIFFTQQSRRHQGKMLGDWIVDLAKEMGLRGATLSTGIEGFGHTGRLHSSHFLSSRINLLRFEWLSPRMSPTGCSNGWKPKIFLCFL